MAKQKGTFKVGMPKKCRTCSRQHKHYRFNGKGRWAEAGVHCSSFDGMTIKRAEKKCKGQDYSEYKEK